MAGETFKLNFISNGEGEKTIDEPIGFDSIPFTLKQKSKGYGRDVFFGGDDENKFKYSSLRDHYIETFLYYYETFGWESHIQLIIEKDGIDNIVGDHAFQSAETDLLETFESKVIQDNDQALLKRRSEINVDMFSDTDVDGEAITPLVTENVLIKSKPVTQLSAWETPEAYSKNLNAVGDEFTQIWTFNPAIALTKFGIGDSYTFFENTFGLPFINSEPFKIIEAQNNLRKIKVNITNLDLDIQTDVDNKGDGYIDLYLVLRYGQDEDNFTEHVFFNKFLREHQTYSNTNDYNFEIPILSRGESVWLFFWAKVRQSANPIFPTGTPRFEAFTTVNSMNVDIESTSLAYNTIAPTFRLYDAVNQTVKSTSNLTTSFPLAESGGELYNNRIFNGNLLRGLTDRAFNLSLDRIEKWLPEINGDFEVHDGTVFFGTYRDFYQNTEIGVFTDVRFDTYKKMFNPRYAINQLTYKYNKFQSQKENEEENSFDISHGSTQWSILNKFVENKKEAEVEFNRDTFLIDEQRRKAFNLNDNTATQDDETIFILDCKKVNFHRSFTETDFLQHTFDEDTGYLKLTNTGSFNWELLGLAVGEVFSVQDDPNSGVYAIIEITPRYIVIGNEIGGGVGDTANNGERITKFLYYVSVATAPYTSWSNEGFTTIDGITDTDNYANLRYTVKRNIKRFYNEYLATANLFAKKPINNTLYRNNGDLTLIYEGEQTTEKASFTPTDPILSPYMHDITVITDFNTFMDLQNKVKTERGFIRCFDANGHVIKLYPMEMTFKSLGGELRIKGEEKYSTSLININTGLGYVVVNEEYRSRKITYRIDGEKVSIMDETGLLMYNPVFWQKVTINGANPETKEDLDKLLKLLT